MTRTRTTSSLVVLAATNELARQHADNILNGRTRTVEIIGISQRADIYALYGRSKLPFDVMPKTPFQPWHLDLKHHIAWGRIVPVRQLDIIGLTGDISTLLLMQRQT